jgi:hypothetical protein
MAGFTVDKTKSTYAGVGKVEGILVGFGWKVVGKRIWGKRNWEKCRGIVGFYM